MKQNPVRILVGQEFKKILAIEAASRGKSIIDFSIEVAQKKEPIKEIVDEWDKKWKKVVPKHRFDFP